MYYSRQEIFDLAVGGMVKQGVLASNITHCSYFNEFGHKCAMGQLLSDEDAEKVERDYSSEPIKKMPPHVLDLFKIGPEDVSFAARIQEAHDSASNVADFVGLANIIAETYGLEPYNAPTQTED